MLQYFILLFIIGLSYGQFRENNQCQTYSGRRGTCKKYSYCPTAQYYFQYYRISPNVCYYQGAEPVVCCEGRNRNRQQTNSQNIPQRSERVQTNRLSEKKCNAEYSGVPSSVNVQRPIVGGTKTNPNEFEFMTAIGWRRSDGKVDWRCGGVLVSRNFVLTSAHCTSIGGQAPGVVRIGGNPLFESKTAETKIRGIYVYPNYNPAYNYHDLALLSLSSSSIQKPACLWTNNIFNHKQVTAIGYGHTQFGGSASSDLLKVSLGVFGNRECQQYYAPQEKLPNGIVNSQICVGLPGQGKDTCQGDSGGPILVKVVKKVLTPYVIGITSFGQICASNSPSVYARVTPYLDWIESIVWASG